MSRVLIVEDEKEVSDLIARSLRREKFDVDLAYNFEEGLQKAKEGFPIVLLDINLEGTESFPILERAKQINPDSIVLMVTGHDEEENVEKSRRLGADGFIPKPIMSDFLKKFIIEKIKDMQMEKKIKGS